MSRVQFPFLGQAAHLSTPVWIWVLLVLTSGCGKDDEDPPDPPTPPQLEVNELRAVGGESYSPAEACAELGVDADQSLLVVVAGSSATTIADWILRPPGACKSVAACGHLEVRVDPYDGDTGRSAYALQATSATTTVTLPFARPCPNTAPEAECSVPDDLSGEHWIGSHSLQVTLRNDDGFPVYDALGNPIRTTLQVYIAAPDGC